MGGVGDPHVSPNRHALYPAAGHAERTGQDLTGSHGENIQRSGFPQRLQKLVGEEPTPLLGEEMERAIKELPRDPEIIDLFKKLNAAGALPARQ